MDQIEANSASYYRLHQRFALVALLTNEIQKQQQQQSLFENISSSLFHEIDHSLELL